MLFILAIDPLQKIIEKAVKSKFLKPVLPRPASLHCSLYADDAGIFVNPEASDLQALHGLLQAFSACSGLKFNLAKTEIYPIRCQPGVAESLIQVFPGRIATFPGKYLGLPLHIRKLRRIDVQPLIDKIRDRLPRWKGKLLSKAGRETLVKTMLSSQPIYHLTVFPAQKYLIKQIDKLRRSFLWKGDEPENTCGGLCLINWNTTARPKSLGGLGILDLERFARALRLRWLWFQWKNKERAWVGLDVPCTSVDRDLFHASTLVSVGNGEAASFWYSNWINGSSARSLAPSLFEKTIRKKVTVSKAIERNKWISHVQPVESSTEIKEFVVLWEAISEVTMDTTREDEIRWRWTPDGEYTTKSAYLAQFHGSMPRLRLLPIWKAKTEPKCRFFAWTLLHRKILTANNLLRRGWLHDPICKLLPSKLWTDMDHCTNGG
ncbi:hypothetical protein U9M48_041103 [Paspalum notatum var. saurae]|uniref:Reverse transcriptase zinc-binding domain-containing protein n=1 Tax=Paspalum notatum var. saurae TaxID=547442 RepID=A0AAQ3XEW8_PASNO